MSQTLVKDLKKLIGFAKTSEDVDILRSAKILEADLIQRVAHEFFGRQCHIIAMPKNSTSWLITVQFRSLDTKTFNVISSEDTYSFVALEDDITKTVF